MSGLSSNRAINTFFQFSIERGDGSHARQLLDKVALSDPLKKQILELIASVPVPADKREELDRLLGSDINSTQGSTKGKPAKIPTSGMLPPSGTHSLNPETGCLDRLNRTVRTHLCTFLQCRELAKLQEVNSNWQRDTLDGLHLHLRQLRALDLSNNGHILNHHAKALHVDNPGKCFKYYHHIEVLSGTPGFLADICQRLNIMQSWEKAASVKQLNMFISPNQVQLQFSRFPSLTSLSLCVLDSDREAWVPSVFESYTTTLQHLTLNSKSSTSKKTATRAVAAISGFSQLQSLKLCLAHLSAEGIVSSVETQSALLTKVLISNPNLTALVLKELGDPVNGVGFQNENLATLRHIPKNLRKLALTLAAPVLDGEENRIFSMHGIECLAQTCPDLISLDLSFEGEDREAEVNSLMLPFEGAGVIARSWPNLIDLGIQGVWNLDSLDTMMAGHPRLKKLVVNHQGKPEHHSYYWRNPQNSITSICETIAKYGKEHLEILALMKVPFNLQPLTKLLTTCTHIRMLVLQPITEWEASETQAVQDLAKTFAHVQMTRVQPSKKS